MVRFPDQTTGAAFLLSGMIHLLLITGLSLWSPLFIVSSQEQPIAVQLLETRPQEKLKSFEATERTKKVWTTTPIKKESKELPDLKPLNSEPADRPQEPTRAPVTPNPSPKIGGSDANSLTAPGSLELTEGRPGGVALLPGHGSTGSQDRGVGRGQGSGGAGMEPGERGFRAAKPIQTAKASYPLMALRMGLEADAVLKILVDAEGKVVKVEIIKSAGMGFDEEALKAVRQFRFEPARRDGRNVASEFTYIYRFRLEK